MEYIYIGFMFFLNEMILGISGFFIMKAILSLREPTENISKRKHTAIKSSNYDNSFNTRAYDIYKNEKTGLYEPQKPKGGIEIKKPKEE